MNKKIRKAMDRLIEKTARKAYYKALMFKFLPEVKTVEKEMDKMCRKYKCKPEELARRIREEVWKGMGVEEIYRRCKNESSS
jgi:hypothetical protein